MAFLTEVKGTTRILRSDLHMTAFSIATYNLSFILIIVCFPIFLSSYAIIILIAAPYGSITDKCSY